MHVERTAPSAAFESDVVLRDGGTLHVRRVTREDVDALRGFLDGLSQESRYLRFFSGGADTDRAARWAAGVGERDGLGLIVSAGRPERIVGHAEYERIDALRAEVAFAIADALRGRGLATVLMAQLAQAARDAGIETFEADVLPQNVRMLEVFRESGFPMRIVRAADGVSVELCTELSPATLERYFERERVATAAAVRHLLEPASAAIVGASRREGGTGRQVLDAVRRSGFDGPVYVVNPHAAAVDGLRAYGSVADLPEAVELAIVAVPATSVIEVARQCALAGVRAMIVLSGGFAEVGPEGVERQEELLAICRASGMRLLGPNCLGAMSAVRPLDATFAPRAAPPGRLALLSQSGGVGLALIDRAASLHLGLSSFVSIGNRADLSVNDLLEYWEQDDSTDAVLLYLESFGNPRNFARIARRLSRMKPIVAVRAGRSAAGMRGAQSHTGAVAVASGAGTDALFKQAGVIRVDTLGELFDVGMLLASQPLPRGRRVGVVTNAGGPAILCVDACVAGGVEVPALSEGLRGQLERIAAPHASVGNPVDLLAAAGPAEFRQAVELLGASGDVDAIIAICTPVLATTADQVRPALSDAELPADVPLLSVLFGRAHDEDSPERRAAEFGYPEGAARALAAVANHADWRRRPAGHVPPFADVDEGELATWLAGVVADGERWLDPAETAWLLGGWGVRLVEGVFAAGPAAAARAAEELGGAVVLKATAPTLVHKTEVGAVQLGLEGGPDVHRVATSMARRLRRAGMKPTGFLVQRQLTGGVEMLVGVASDPLLGPLVACGAGGTLTELIGDVEVALAPLSDLDAARMVRSLRAWPLLEGYRGGSRADVPAFEDLLLRLGRLAATHPEVVELDCNPVVVGPSGAIVVDARVRVAPSRRPPPWPSVSADAPLVASA